MTDYGTRNFESAYAIPMIRGTVRLRKRDVIARAVCTGVERMREPSEQGLVTDPRGTVRYLLSEEPTPRVKPGDVLEIKLPYMTDYLTVRCEARNDIGGAVRLEVEAEFA